MQKDNSNIKRALVTGSTGFLGYHMVNELLKLGYEVVGVDNFCRSSMDSRAEQLHKLVGYTFIECDLTDQHSVANLPNGFDLIFHLAAMNGTQNFYNIPFDVSSNCTLPTFNLINKYKDDTRLNTFFYAGTSETYSSTVSRFSWPIPTDEEVPLCIDDINNPRWSYAVGKLSGESACIAAGLQYNFPYVIGRFHNIYGPRNGEKHFIPDFIQRCLHGKFELFGHSDTRSFLYVKDAINAIIKLTEISSAKGQIVNIGSDIETPILEVAKIIMKEMGIDNEIILHSSPKGSVSRRCPDIKKLISLIQFRPMYSLKEGLRLTIDDIYEHGI